MKKSIYVLRGSKEESLKTLQELDERKMYIGYVSLDKIMSYADFKKYVDKQDLAEVWCAVQVAELEKEEEGVVNFQSNIPNIGFVCNPSYNTAIKWDEKKYQTFYQGVKHKIWVMRTNGMTGRKP